MVTVYPYTDNCRGLTLYSDMRSCLFGVKQLAFLIQFDVVECFEQVIDSLTVQNWIDVNRREG